MEEGQSQVLMEVRRAGELFTEVAGQQLQIVPQIPIGTRLYEGMDDGASTVHNL
jgi:hypothetical protein